MRRPTTSNSMYSTVGVGRSPAQLDVYAESGHLENGCGGDHVAHCVGATFSDHPRRVNGFTVRPAAESAISAASRRSRVSGRFALVTQCSAARR